MKDPNYNDYYNDNYIYNDELYLKRTPSYQGITRLNLTDKIDVQRNHNCVALSNLIDYM